MAGAGGAEALAVFRSLLRTRKKCFAGDPDMLAASAKQIRDEFDTYRNVGDGEELDILLAKAREAIEFMKINIVQAKLNERGNYEVKLGPEHRGASISLEDIHNMFSTFLNKGGPPCYVELLTRDFTENSS